MRCADLQGVDASWLASDAIGQVAVFTTGGEGPIPLSALPSTFVVENMLQALQPVSAWTLIVHLPRPADFVAFAQRGLFSYDWSDVHRAHSKAAGRYDLQASPLQPLSVGQLPEDLQKLASATTLVSVRFGTKYGDVGA